jgi:signal transduction histidine kinase
MSLRARLLLAAAYILTVTVVALEIPLAITIRSDRTRELTSTVLSYTALVASAINDDLAALTTPNPLLSEPAEAIGTVADAAARRTQTPARIIVVDAAGRLVHDTAGQVPPGTLYATDERPELGMVLDQGEGALPDVQIRASDSVGEPLLLVTAPVLHDRGVIGAVRASLPISDLNGRVLRSWLGLGGIGLTVILIGLALAWLMAGSIARPVERLERTAEDLGRGTITARAPVQGPKEVASLSASFNRMADGMEANISAQRDFVANASHQLRTPMTGLRLRLEAIEGEGGFTGEQASKAQVELTRLASLVDDLLALAKASSVGAVGTRVDLDRAVRQAADRWTATAANTGAALEVGRCERVAIVADDSDVGHVLDNLIENAIRYAGPGSHIMVEAYAAPRTAVLAVVDDGPGIPQPERERIFERFFRGSTGRSSGPGTGLGLAIAAELVTRWSGALRLDDVAGTRFEARFPRDATVPSAGADRAPTIP